MATNILVTGATGTQGGAVIDSLLGGEYGEFEVFGLTRDASSDAATALDARGVTLVEGDMTDGDAMRAAVDGMDAVFAVTTFFEAGPEAEREQGITVADAALEAGVEHFVLSSVGSADADTGLAHFESKADVEAHVAELDLPTTVLRPVFFLQNLETMLRSEIEDGRLPLALSHETELAVVDARDIGRAVGAALADPERFLGETITLAGDSLTTAEMAAAFADALGREVEPIALDVDDYRAAAGDEMADMFVWFDEVGYDVDPDALRVEYGLETTDLETYLAESDVWKPVGTPAN